MVPWIMSLGLAKKQVQKMVESFHKKYIKKSHSFILCKHEKRTSIRLDLLLEDTPTTYRSKPFGILQICPYDGFERPTKLAMDIIRALIFLLDLVHESGYSFDGQLTIKNLYWVPEIKAIKIAGLTIGEMVKKTDERIESDFKCQRDMIREEVFARSKVPRELLHLLRFMVTNPIQYRRLITHNICLLDDEAKVGRYIALYQKLSIIKRLDHIIFQKALSYVTCGKKRSSSLDWQHHVNFNKALTEVYRYKRIPDYYKPNEDGVTWFGRNCCGHVTDCSVDTENGGQKVIKYTNADTFPMLECHIPGLFSQVEEAVFAIVMLHYPQELQCLINKSTCCV